MKKRVCLLYSLLIASFLLSAVLSVGFGAVKLSLRDILGALVGAEGFETERIIVVSLRLPRLLAASIAGAGLALSGTVLQIIMGNDLASPNTVGVNAGAGLAVIAAFTFFPTIGIYLPFAAFAGAMLTLFLIISFAGRAGGSKSSVILAGIACSTLFQAGISFFSILDADVLSMYNSFSVGSFTGVTAEELVLPLILIILCYVLSVITSRSMSALSLGDRIAAGLGVRVRAVRSLCLIIAGLSAAAVISFAGLLGFVGLVVPHITRKLAGSDTRRLLICAPIVGATTVNLSDLLGRVLFAPSEIPVGIVMAFVGAPFFLMLLLKRRLHDA